MSYIDSLLENIKDDTYSWKNVSDPGFRAGFGVEQQVSDELTGANGFNGMSRGKAERIAQIKKRLAEIAEEKKKYDIEDAMGRYKFLYDADPSVLTNYRQQKRTEKMNADMRKATEAATRESNLQTAWKQNGIDLEVAKYDLAAAKNSYNEAKGAGNTDAMKRAMTDIKRAQAKYDRIVRENDTLRGKMMNSLGISLGDEQKLDDDIPNANGPDYAKELADAEAIKKLDGSLELLDRDIIVDNINVDKKTKLANVQKWLANIEQAKKDVDASPLSTEQKNARTTKLADLEKKVRDYAKPKGKGGQGTKMTKDDYQKAIDGKNDLEIAKLGYAYLKAAKAAGVAVPDRAFKFAQTKTK
jgi:hypothetical protein